MNQKILMWDIDGVLMHVSESYRKAIIETVQYYFSDLAGLSLKSQIMDLEDTQRFKNAGGFNDDWELTYAAVLAFLCAMVSKIRGKKPPEVQPESFDSMIAELKALGESYSPDTLEVDLDAITCEIKNRGGGPDVVFDVLGSFFGDDASLAKAFWFPSLMKRIFEERYLGGPLFEEKYKEKPIFYSGDGLIQKETSLVDPHHLLLMRKKYYFGIVTGRERFEALYSLKKEKLLRLFPPDVIVSREDTTEHKPSPQPLLECRKRIVSKYCLPGKTPVIYVGDSVDDLRAAKNAGFSFVGMLGSVGEPAEQRRLAQMMEKNSADLVVGSASELFLHI